MFQILKEFWNGVLTQRGNLPTEEELVLAMEKAVKGVHPKSAYRTIRRVVKAVYSHFK